MSNFYNKYIEYPDEKLIKIVLEKDNYQKDAVDSAFKIIQERNIESKLNDAFEEKNEEEKLKEQEQIESAEALKGISLEHGINVKFSDAAKFEGELSKQGIRFFRQDKNVGGGVELYPSLYYYFEEKDFEAADKVCIALGITDPYLANKPGLRFELKLIIIIVIIIVLGFLIF